MTSPGPASRDIAGVLFALALVFVLVAAPAATVTIPAVPVIDMVMASRSTVFATQSTDIFCAAHQDDGSHLSYTWSSSSGMLVPDGDSAVWIAPEEAGTYTIGVEVRDEAGSIAYESMNVIAVQNQAPTISSVTAQPSMLLPGETATVTCIATDAEGHVIRYDWLSSMGTIAGGGASITWTAPDAAGTHYVLVRAIDELGATCTRNVPISVRCPEPPEIEQLLVWPTLPDYTTVDLYGNYRLLRGSLTSCELECIAAPRNYGEPAFQWSCTAGTIEGWGPLVLFVPPNAATEVVVTVTISDMCGKSDEAELLFKIYQREEYSNETLSNPGGCLRCLQNR